MAKREMTDAELAAETRLAMAHMQTILVHATGVCVTRDLTITALLGAVIALTSYSEDGAELLGVAESTLAQARAMIEGRRRDRADAEAAVLS